MEGTSFWKSLITDISADDLFRRLVVTACIVFLGVPLATVITRKRRLRTALDESEKRARHLFAEAPLPYQSLDQNGRIIEVNQSWLLTLGYSAGEVSGRNFERFLTPASAEKYRNVFSKLKATGQCTGIELEMARKDGSIVVTSFNGKVVSDENGNFQRTQCLFADITERRRSEKTLQASEEKYRVLVEHANEAIFVAQNGIVKFCNQRMSEILGYSVERITSEPFADYIYADDREGALERHHRRLAGEELPSNDLRVIAADSVKWLEINGVLIEWEGKPATLNFANDITERKRAEEALRNSEIFLNSIFEQSPHAMWVSDSQGTMIRLNQALRDLFHVTDDDVVGKYNVFQDTNIEEQGYMPLVKRVFENGETVRSTLVHDTKQLRALDLKEYVSLLMDPRSHRQHHRSGHRDGLGRLRHRHRRRASSRGHRRATRCAQRGPAPDVRLVQPDDRQ